MTVRSQIWKGYARLSRSSRVGVLGYLRRTNQPLAASLGRRVKALIGAGLKPQARVGEFMLNYRAGSGELHLEYAVDTYEPAITRLFQGLIRPGDTVLDVGANLGYFTLLAASVTGSAGAVHAFEPDPVNFSTLQLNVEANQLQRRVRLCACAVGESAGGSLRLYRGSSSSTTSRFHTVHESGEATFTVPTMTLDHYLEGLGWPAVAFVKIDVEGAEFSVLRGARQTVARNPGLQLLAEFSPAHQAAAGVSPEAFFEAFSVLGFRYMAALDDLDRPLSAAVDLSALAARMPAGECTAIYCGPRAPSC